MDSAANTGLPGGPWRGRNGWESTTPCGMAMHGARGVRKAWSSLEGRGATAEQPWHPDWHDSVLQTQRHQAGIATGRSGVDAQCALGDQAPQGDGGACIGIEHTDNGAGACGQAGLQRGCRIPVDHG